MSGSLESPNPLIRDLHKAVKNLEEFIKQNASDSIPNLHRLDFIDGNVVADDSKSPDLLSVIMNQAEYVKTGAIQKKLLESIEYLKRHHRMIEKLQDGSDQEQKWAKWALETIEQYNVIVEKVKSIPRSLKNRVTKYVLEKSGFSIHPDLIDHKIEISCDPSFYFNSSHVQDEVETTSQKIKAMLCEHKISKSPLSNTETDIFRMKAISMSKDIKLPNGLKESLKSLLWDSPIHSIDNEPDDSIISIVQTLAPFPGEIIRVHGAFKRNKDLLVPSIPITDKFKITSSSKQTGFPDASQYTGFALDSVLIPDCPHRLDLIPEFHLISEKKQELAHKLLPAGSLNEKAKKLLKEKQDVFNQNRDTLFSLHKKLAHTIAVASNIEIDSSHIDIFFEKISSFEQLSSAYRLINQLFIANPYNQVHKEWLDNHNDQLIHAEPKGKFQACIGIIDNTITDAVNILLNQIEASSDELEKAVLAYVMTMGHLIGSASRGIILQKLSEKITYPPPLLNNFERKMQNCLYRQLLIFQIELDTLNTISSDYLSNLIKYEISLFQAELEDDPFQDHAQSIINELEIYYNARYFKEDLINEATTDFS